MLKPVLRLVAVAAISFALAAPAFAADTLYKRLGGYDAIAAVSDDFIARLQSDNELKHFLDSMSTDTLHRTRQLIVEFLCEKSGGPCFYTGRTMALSHKGLHITAKDWEEMLKLFGQTLDKFKVDPALQKDVVAFIGALRKDIVEG